MKKLKYFLIPLISLLFIINVNASTINLEIPEYNKERINNNMSLMTNTYNYLINNNYINEDDILWFNFDFLNSSTINVRVLSSNYELSNRYIWGNWYTLNHSDSSITGLNSSGYGSYTAGISTTISSGYWYNNSGNNTTLNVVNNTNNEYILNSSNDVLSSNSSMNLKEFITKINQQLAPPIVEPTYSYTSTILDNGNVKLDFTFTNYTSESGYAFEIENYVSNQEYGITNTYSNIFPNQIPFDTSYSIELAYDSLLYVTLSKYEQVEQTSLYSREEIYTNMIDINNVVFENEQEPYFVIYRQTENLIEGSFANTTSNNTCWYRYSTSQNEDFVPCDEMLGLSFYDNGYVEVLIKKGSTTIYSRKINYLGSTSDEPYIIYNVTKQDFYSVLNFSVENYISGLTYRVSTDNGINFSNWQTYDNTKNNFINVFDNSTIIIEIANSNQSTIYDSKSIVVVNNINDIKSINNTTTNFLDKFRSIFNVNTNILRNINNFYDNIKLSKIYLLIFIPFLASLIGAIIYLIRRK